jgi:very-short-patch-repair endonuclease
MRAPILTAKRAKALRLQPSLPEAILWRALRGGQLNGLRFRRQHPIGPYILDFYCPQHRLAVEVDGASHSYAQQAYKDEIRDRWLADQGIRVLRIAAVDILKDERLADFLLAIADAAAAPSVGFADSSPVNGVATRTITAGETP